MTISPQRRSFRAALVACAVLLAGGCAPATPSIAAAPAPAAEPETRLAPRTWTAQSPAGEIAAWAREGCRRPAGGKDACLERMLVSLVEQAGVARSMEVLDSLAAADPEVANGAHPLAHGLGIAAYRSPETVAATFAACPASQMSGCSHGVVQGYFLDLLRQGRGVGTAELDALCDAHAESQFLLSQCAHGAGHGLMAVHQNHVPMALAACDLATRHSVRENCYSGVFMENVVNVTHPHHTAGGHATVQGGDAADGHGGHGAAQPASTGAHAHGAAAQGGHDAHAGHVAAGAQAMQHGEWVALKPDDLQYPCNVVGEKYQQSCYAMQTSAVMYFNHGNVAATARMCERAEGFLSTCFMSLGRDITAWANRDHDRTREMCARVGEAAAGRARVWCAQGAVTTLVNYTSDSGEGMRFCLGVAGAEAQRECYRTVGDAIALLRDSPDEQARLCEAATESDFVAACRQGAGLRPLASGSDE
ncbi:MAG TPA: hypothetical protein VE871_19590 [Longimicrobium sp.]|nr:hypothetical protein [Longimicrobium sp.]